MRNELVRKAEREVLGSGFWVLGSGFWVLSWKARREKF